LAADFPLAPQYRADLAGVLSTRATLQRRRGDDAAAEKSLKRSLDLFTALSRELPEVADYRLRRSNVLAQYGHLLKDRGDLPAAARAYRDAAELRQAQVGKAPSWPELPSLLATVRADLAQCLLGQKKEADARRQYDEAIKDLTPHVGQGAGPEWKLALAR